jgi:hypothetical protein
MAHFVKISKHCMNCISNHRLIGLLIRRGMGIPNDPLHEVEEQPNSIPIVMAEPKNLNPMPAIVIEPIVENPIPRPSHEPHPSAATTVENPIPGPSHESQPLATTVVKSPIVTSSMLTQRRKHQTKRNSNTTQRRKRKTIRKFNTTQRGINRVEPEATQNPPIVAIECPDFADTQTLPYFDINDTNLIERIIDFMEVHIPSFTLCKEFQETIVSL